METDFFQDERDVASRVPNLIEGVRQGLQTCAKEKPVAENRKIEEGDMRERVCPP